VRKYNPPKTAPVPVVRERETKPVVKPKPVRPVVVKPTVVVKPKKKTCRKSKDRIATNICKLLKGNGLCWAKYTKTLCWNTCGVCTSSDMKDVGDKIRRKRTRTASYILNGSSSAVISNRRSRKVYVGMVTSRGKYNGAGYLVNGIHKGDSYWGYFKNGQFHGKGTYTYRNKDSYTGDFYKNSFQGTGTYNQPSKGETYTGQWKGDKKNGKGVWKNNDGESYTGSFKNDQSNGYGVWSHPDGDIYKGYFKNDLFEGQGTYTYSDGYTESGRWN